MAKITSGKKIGSTYGGYEVVLSEVVGLLEEARRSAARSVNAIMTATYWEIGRRIVEHEQEGLARAVYGEGLLHRLSRDLKAKFGRGFSVDNLESMRLFYIVYAQERILEGNNPKTEKSGTPSRKSRMQYLAEQFPLSWSHYVVFVRRVKSAHARSFYETEALRNGWTVRQLSRQIESQFYERTALSRNKEAMLKHGATIPGQDKTAPENEIKDPFVLEFLDVKDEYSENDLEKALIKRLESFLLELGGDFYLRK